MIGQLYGISTGKKSTKKVVSVENGIFEEVKFTRRVDFSEKICHHIIGALVDGENKALLIKPTDVVMSDEHVSRVASDFRSFNKINGREVVFMDDGRVRLGKAEEFKELAPKNTLPSSATQGFILPLLRTEGDAGLSRCKGGICSIVVADKVKNTR